MATTEATPEMQEAPIDAAVVERVGERAELDSQRIANAIIALNAELLGRHSSFERDYNYVTIDGTRAYRVHEAEWEALTDDFDLDDGLATSVRAAHTEQARLLFARSVCSNDVFEAEEAGVVIGIETAEQF
ncbi:MAG: hypothetical protein ACI8UR_000832 [Natronomonas sp.]|jgi:hypothetical protein|uniref:hypothetical protein n=1 Tax=Natronomonas sp. TaxID=2184060 RepID=UPI003988F3F3